MKTIIVLPIGKEPFWYSKEGSYLIVRLREDGLYDVVDGGAGIIDHNTLLTYAAGILNNGAVAQ